MSCQRISFRVSLAELKATVAEWNVPFRLIEKISLWNIKSNERILAGFDRDFTEDAIVYTFLKLLPELVTGSDCSDLTEYSYKLRESYSRKIIVNKKDRHFNTILVLTIKVIVYFISNHISQLEIDRYFESEVYVILINVLLGVRIAVKTYDIVLRQVTIKKQCHFRSSIIEDEENNFSNDCKLTSRRRGRRLQSTLKAHKRVSSLPYLDNYSRQIKNQLTVKCLVNKPKKMTVLQIHQLNQLLKNHRILQTSDSLATNQLSSALSMCSSLRFNMVKEVQLKRKHSDNKFRDFDLEVCTIRDKKVVTQVPLVEEGKEKVKIDWIQVIGNIKKRTYPTETWALSDQIMEREIITNKMISNESNSASSCLVKQKSESDLSNKSSRQAFLKVKFTKVPLPKRHLTENVTCKDLLKHKQNTCLQPMSKKHFHDSVSLKDIKNQYCRRNQ